MRVPESDEDLVGKVCVCSMGRVAVVTGRHEFEWGLAWVGLGFDGKGSWASRNPCISAESAEEFRERLVSRFGGSMCYQDQSA